MLSTAGYYCSRGHVWEATTNTRGHDEVLKQPCLDCMLTATERVSMSVHGPFNSMADAQLVMSKRGIQPA